MKLDVYGRFQLDVVRENETWAVYRLGLGTRTRAADIVIPPSVVTNEIATYLDDIFHELSGPDKSVRRLP